MPLLHKLRYSLPDFISLLIASWHQDLKRLFFVFFKLNISFAEKGRNPCCNRVVGKRRGELER